MDYQAIYDRIIERNRTTPRIKKQTESHHIIPKSFAKLDGIEDIDGSWNKVNLPLREHFICHLLLARIWRDHKDKGKKMAWAFNQMSICRNITSISYKWLKSNLKHSDETLKKMSISHKNVSKETRLKMSMAAKNRTEEQRKRIGEKTKGRKHSDETKARMSKTRKGRKLSNECKQLLSKMKKGIPKEKFTCHICGKEIGGKPNYNRHLQSHS